MADFDFWIAQGDTAPIIETTLLGPDGEPLDLTGATVEFRMAPNCRDGAELVGSASVIGDPTLGVVRYTWQAADTAVAGEYDYQWVATLQNGQVVTVPNDRYRTLLIQEKITSPIAVP